MLVAVDFDGTLHDGKWPSIGNPMEHAYEAMCGMKDMGVTIVIWTCRCGDEQTAMVNWLIEQGIPFDRVNDNMPEHIEHFKSNARKVHADMYIDDKQVGGLPPWKDIYEYVKVAKNEFDKKMSAYENGKRN